MDFVHEINRDKSFCEPMLSNSKQMQSNLLDAPKKANNRIFGVFDGEEIIGLFVFLVLEQESYIEMIVGLSRCEHAYHEVMSYLKRTYKGCQADFVYNPGNNLLHEILQEEHAKFYPEQQKMVLKNLHEHVSGHQIELYHPKYKEQYVALHGTSGYWTAEKVLEAMDRFRVILGIEDGEVVGYLDVTYKYEENEPYDLYVKEKYRRQGYGKAMLAKAIAMNQPKDMMVLVDADELAAIGLYKSMGFEKVVEASSVTAQVVL